MGTDQNLPHHEGKLSTLQKSIQELQARLDEAAASVMKDDEQRPSNDGGLASRDSEEQGESVQRFPSLTFKNNCGTISKDPAYYGDLSECRGTLADLKMGLQKMKDCVETGTRSFRMTMGTLAQVLTEQGHMLVRKIAEEKSEHCKTRALLDATSMELKRVVQENKALRNTVHNLKGNIRVFARVRPPLPSEVGSEDSICIEKANDTELEIKAYNSTKSFELDKVFGQDSSQEDVFEEISELVKSAIDGFSVCIFAYGQTGSGKTFTMEGSNACPGIVQQSLQQIFDRSQVDSRYKDSISLAMVEIYNENVRDLLSDKKVGAPQNMELRQGANGMTIPDGALTEVHSNEEAIKVFARGSKNRTVHGTRSNSRSSRSHSVLMVKIERVDTKSQRKTLGKLYLVDLAGSERLSKTAATGERLKEAQNINRSLSAFGDVISALLAKEKHIPFRNSKLTYLLQDSLGGEHKALMLVHLSPMSSSHQESYCTLKFACRVRNVELGRAKKQHEDWELLRLKQELAQAKMLLECRGSQDQGQNGIVLRHKAPFGHKPEAAALRSGLVDTTNTRETGKTAHSSISKERQRQAKKVKFDLQVPTECGLELPHGKSLFHETENEILSAGIAQGSPRNAAGGHGALGGAFRIHTPATQRRSATRIKASVRSMEALGKRKGPWRS